MMIIARKDENKKKYNKLEKMFVRYICFNIIYKNLLLKCNTRILIYLYLG